MNENNEYLKMQRSQLAKVFEYLKMREKKNTQKEIAARTGVDEIYLSHLKSGVIKYIPNEFLINLNTAFNINPAYIRLESEFILDVTGTKLEHFEKFADSWDVVEKDSDRYLHFTMDRNFYDFLLEVEKARLATDEGISSLDTEIKNLKELYSGSPNPEEFVLIPKNNFIEIVQESVYDHKKLSEVIDLLECKNYLDE